MTAPAAAPRRFENPPAHAFAFATALDPAALADETTPAVLVRSAGAIDHPWWGRIVHDMAGVEPIADRYCLDYCHDADQILGFADGVRIDQGEGGGLMATPHLVVNDANPEDRAGDVLRKSKAGTPYQASLDWRGPFTYEIVDVGASVLVNGQTFEGPGVVIRKWRINGVAICPYGADPSTWAQFQAGPFPAGPFQEATRGEDAGEGRDPNDPLSKTLANQGRPMSQEQKPADDFRQTFQRFARVFGAERAFALVDAGTSFESALEAELTAERQKFATQFEAAKQAADAELAKSQAALDEANQKLAALRATAGEANPLPGGEGDTQAPANPNQAFAQFIRFRSSR